MVKRKLIVPIEPYIEEALRRLRKHTGITNDCDLVRWMIMSKTRDLNIPLPLEPPQAG